MTNERTQAKWTPAPWEVAEKTDLGDVFVEASSGERVAMACWEGEWSDSMGAATEANAYLIAAAPALHEALNRYYAWDCDFRDVQHKAPDYGLPVPEYPESSYYMEGWLQEHIRGPVEAALAKANGPAVGHTDLF